ncbi:uncharacterized protein [Prorops nasuta]|uniref:uncharacterized protein n=1 Tax=Prorops nasuta TaxID=863751 RepID=UPI0034CFD2B4
MADCRKYSRVTEINHSCNVVNLDELVNRFWNIEELPNRVSRSADEMSCENHYIENTVRGIDGRYTVRLPFNNDGIISHDSRSIALKRLLLLERKFKKNPELQKEYTRITEEDIELNHTSLANSTGESEYHMPHHAVIKQSSLTTKVRIVFDASAKINESMSLNELLLVSPTIQEPLITHLIRFRTYKFVVTADITKMCRQIWVHSDDRRYQRILWRHDDNIKSFELNTLIFGVASSPFLAIRTLHRLADDEVHRFPRAANIIKSHMYVGDLLTGANSIKILGEIRDEIISLLKCGGFEIRQWASNENKIINDLTSKISQTEFVLKIEPTSKTLGLTWRTTDGKICYIPCLIQITERLTKRVVLSEIAKIFDPLGLLGPIIFFAKKLMQDLWKSGIHWDETIPPSIHTSWLKLIHQWETLGEIAITRHIIVNECINLQLYGFCDASSSGYGACIYLRSQNNHGEMNCHLISAKSRIAPIKTSTIPVV